MIQENPATKLRLTLGGGHYLDQDMPTPEIIKAIKRVVRLVERQKPPESRKDVQAATLVRDWMETQHQKHGGIKYRNQVDRN